MRILVVAEPSNWVEYQIVGSLMDMGHEVHRFYYGAFIGEFYGHRRRSERAAKNQGLLKLANELAEAGRLDLIFCYVYDDFLTVECARQLAGLNVPLVNLNVDMVNQWYRQIRTAKYFDYILCAHKANMKSVARYGGHPLYFPMAARPIGEDASSAEITIDAPVTFLGTPLPIRVSILGELQRSGISVAVYGKQWTEMQSVKPERNMEKTLRDIFHYAWPRVRCEGMGAMLSTIRGRLPRRMKQDRSENEILNSLSKHGFVPDGAVALLFRKSTINLGFNRMIGADPEKPGMNQIKLRDFEVPLAGGFYLVEHAPDYDELFVPDKEVVTWHTPGELREKIHYYLSHESERRNIAEAGQKRAMAEHTWARRFSGLFSTLQLQ